eukprot:ANDGO_04486.mRNA.1 Vesicle-associated membrane protein 713
MSILYAVVARQTTVLAQHSSTKGNMDAICERILAKIPSTNSMMSYVYEEYMFHYIVEDGLCFMCMSSQDFSRRVAFAFLKDVRGRWIAQFGARGSQALAFTMQDEFSKVLKTQMNYFSTNPNADKLTTVKNQIDEVKNVMVKNIDMVLEREEKLQVLVEKSDDLTRNAGAFRKQGSALKRAMWWKNAKLTLLIVGVVGATIFVITWIACGSKFQKCQ